jgi:protein SCO1/2
VQKVLIKDNYFNKIIMKAYILLLILITMLYSCTDGIPSVKTASQTGLSPAKPVKGSCCKAPKKAELSRIPSESIFTLNDTFTTQNNARIKLSSLMNKPTVVGMIFTHCTYACPRLTSDIKSIYKNMGSKKDQVNYVLISFDTERDSPERLKEFAKEMGLDSNWTLLRGSEQSVRTLSVLLNVQYEKDLEGNFSHSNLVSVLDSKGVLKFQKEGLGADHNETLNILQKFVQ